MVEKLLRRGMYRTILRTGMSGEQSMKPSRNEEENDEKKRFYVCNDKRETGKNFFLDFSDNIIRSFASVIYYIKV